MSSKDPNTHLTSFLEICNMVKDNRVNKEVIRLRLFPFSFKDRAKNWLNSMPPDSITNWEDLVQKILAKFYPPSKTTQMSTKINNFAHMDSESIHEAWER